MNPQPCYPPNSAASTCSTSKTTSIGVTRSPYETMVAQITKERILNSCEYECTLSSTLVLSMMTGLFDGMYTTYFRYDHIKSVTPPSCLPVPPSLMLQEESRHPVMTKSNAGNVFFHNIVHTFPSIHAF